MEEPNQQISQPKSNTLILILGGIFIIVLIILATTSYFVFFSDSDATSDNGSNQNNAIQQEDCGTILIERVILKMPERTEEDLESIRCFNQALLECVPKTFKTTGGDDYFNYEIHSLEGDLCSISVSSNTRPTKTCKFPLSYIQDSNTFAIDTEQPDNLFVAISMGLSFGGGEGRLTNSVTGEQINLICVEE